MSVCLSVCLSFASELSLMIPFTFIMCIHHVIVWFSVSTCIYYCMEGGVQNFKTSSPQVSTFLGGRKICFCVFTDWDNVEHKKKLHSKEYE